MTLIEAAKQARNMLEHIDLQDAERDFLTTGECEELDRIIELINKAIYAQAEQQEPVAWYDAEKDCAYTLSDCEGRAQDDLEPLYLAPPSNPWQGLTDEEIHNTEDYFESRTLYRFARAIEAKLKEKNT